MIMTHELIADTVEKLAYRDIELPTFASPTIEGVTLHNTDVIYGIYREQMIEVQKKSSISSRNAYRAKRKLFC